MSDRMPDWPPAGSAWNLPEGTQRYGSTGQLFEVRNKQWVRVEKGKVRLVADQEDASKR